MASLKKPSPSPHCVVIVCIVGHPTEGFVIVDNESHPTKLWRVPLTRMYSVALMRRGALSFVMMSAHEKSNRVRQSPLLPRPTNKRDSAP